MFLPSAIPAEVEVPEFGATGSQAIDALQIEQILRRAREIHRQHGGMFGYDLEDWAEAWSERPQSRSRSDLELESKSGLELLAEYKTEVLGTCF